MVKQMYLTLGMPLSVVLSFRDEGDNYFGDPKVWERAQAILERVATEEELDYAVELGEAAFYGPKIDIYVSDALGRRWQCATVQLDFVMPERFELEYTDEDGKKQRPAMIHKAILGSIERFLSVYIEHTAGRFPIWLAPEQVRLITVNQEKKTREFAAEVATQARRLGLRLTIDDSNESVGKKIRAAEVAKVPYSVVVGEKEIMTRQVTPRIRKDIAVVEAPVTLGFEEFLKTVANEAKGRVLKTSL
jgi:threonyl-tRNA synthetase